MGKPEGKIEAYLRQQCKKRDYLCFKFAPCGINGVPDRIVIGNGYTIFVELKAPGKKPTLLQRTMHALMRDRGATVCVVDSILGVDNLMQIIDNRYIIDLTK